MIPVWVKTTANTVGWSRLQTSRPRSGASCHLFQKDTFDWLVNTPFQSPIPVSSGKAKQKQYILQILTKSVSKKGGKDRKKKKKRGGAVSWSFLTKWHAFIPAISSLGMSLYLSQLSFALLLFYFFLLLAGKDRRHETFPPFFSLFFLIFDKACEDKSERGGVQFFSNRQPTK